MASDELDHDSSAKLDPRSRLLNAEIELQVPEFDMCRAFELGELQILDALREAWDASLLTAADGLQNPDAAHICSM